MEGFPWLLVKNPLTAPDVMLAQGRQNDTMILHKSTIKIIIYLSYIPGTCHYAVGTKSPYDFPPMNAAML